MTEPDHLRATRAAYDTVAVDYEELLREELADKPLDRALLCTFAELVLAGGNTLVADIGCGPGRVTGYLHSIGLRMFGVDLSPGMIAVANRTYPNLQFLEGSMTDLDLADASLGGIVAWYSIIHTPPGQLPGIFAEFDRVLAPGGYLLLAFQTGDTVVHLEQGYGHAISLDAYRLSPDTIAELLHDAGFLASSRTLRQPDGFEKTPQAYLIARKPSDA